jgi:archaetidylinositol phosphate synthase
MSKRVQQSFLTPLEDPALRWLARHMPARVSPDGLTLLGLGGAILTFAFYVLARFDAIFFWLASFGLLVNWFGDSLDGHLARMRGTERPRYGFYVDHVTDLFSQLFIGAGLALCGAVRPEAAGLALIVYLMVVAATHMAESVTGELHLSLCFFGPTEMRCAIMVLNALLAWRRPKPLITIGIPLTAIDLLIFAISLVALAALAIRAVWQAKQIGLSDPPP